MIPDEDDLRQQEREDIRLDALRTHLVTMVVYGAGLAVVLFVLLFPRAVAFVAIVALGAFLYARLYRFVEERLALLDVVKPPLVARPAAEKDPPSDPDESESDDPDDTRERILPTVVADAVAHPRRRRAANVETAAPAVAVPAVPSIEIPSPVKAEG